MNPNPSPPDQKPPGRSGSGIPPSFVALLLWVIVLVAGVLVAQQRGLCKQLGVALGSGVQGLYRLAWWDWFNNYWWVVVVVFVAAAPVVILVDYRVRRRVRSRLEGWLWSGILVVPPLLVLGLLLTALIVVNNGVSFVVRSEEDRAENYLGPDGRLLAPLHVREFRQDFAAPKGEVLVIGPDGEWRAIPDPNEWAAPPTRQGKLLPEQVELLARHLAAQKFGVMSRSEAGFLPPGPLLDGIVVEFAERHVTLEGIHRDHLRDYLRDRSTLAPGLIDDYSLRAAALVLLIDDLVKPPAPK